MSDLLEMLRDIEEIRASATVKVSRVLKEMKDTLAETVRLGH